MPLALPIRLPLFPPCLFPDHQVLRHSPRMDELPGRDRSLDALVPLHLPSTGKQDSLNKVRNVLEAELRSRKCVAVAPIRGRAMKVDPLLPAVGFPLLGSERERGVLAMLRKGH